MDTRACYVMMLALMVTQQVSAQTGQRDLSQRGPSLSSAVTTHAEEDPCVSWNCLVANMADDRKPIRLLPSEVVHGSNWLSIAGALVEPRGLSTCLRPQETVSSSVSYLVAQAVPGPEDAVQTSGSGAVPPASASIAGTVRDADGVAVQGARVTLAGPNNAVDQVVTADSSGAFTFAELVPGIYQVKIAAAGLERPVTAEVVLGARERRELPIVGARILTTTVHVVATLDEVAQSQVEAQEKQRVLGFLPNYYSSYIWDAVPMTPKLKFKLTLRSTTDPVTFLVAAGLAGVEQKHDIFPGYGQGSEGYAKRFGAAYADTLISKMVSRAILPTVLHQDPRYFYRGSGSIRSRIFYALAAAVITRGDNAQMQPNYSQVLGNFASSGISNLYRAPGDRTVSLTFRNGLIMTASGAVENLLREFFSRTLTSSVPPFANGKP